MVFAPVHLNIYRKIIWFVVLNYYRACVACYHAVHRAQTRLSVLKIGWALCVYPYRELLCAVGILRERNQNRSLSGLNVISAIVKQSKGRE